MNEYTENTKPKRGRPSVDVSWPDTEFTAEEVYNSLEKKLSRVSIHAKINKALKTGRKASVAGLDMRETDARTATQKLQASIIGESTQELEKHTRQEATMAYEMGVQDLRQPICICKYMHAHKLLQYP